MQLQMAPSLLMAVYYSVACALPHLLYPFLSPIPVTKDIFYEVNLKHLLSG